ncbi:DUF1613-domain-containing protein [Leucogyrophana mollusca]|uniref:DUF1613-domain-containing protein n=1 Tax=Leucogyrophana mollusca TaxID=85980 RepID=A0ACB8B7A2_9AGAM|nr:DUF1613-domain-containing protein [Leucogyrophana mollusca]
MSMPRFSPSPCTQDLEIPALSSTWVPLVSCPADFPLELFETAISQLIHHPEYNSTLILRSETISTALPPAQSQHLPGLHPHSNVHRKLLPRRPGRDAALEQHCTLYAYDEGEFAGLPCTLVLTPLTEKEPLPYYHPAVSHLAFRYIPSCLSPTTLRIEVIPLPNTPTDPTYRLYRTALALLDTLHRYGWGALTNYQKRVKHDCLVPRETYQDMYLLMRERHKHLVDEWREVTDPLKHVFEDIGIAMFLMLLWKETFGPVSSSTDDQSIDSDTDSDTVPWNTWPRPPGGFVDLGCGNGLLTHILTAEGYSGHGIDLRARTSWGCYPPSTQRALHMCALDPTDIGSGSDGACGDRGNNTDGDSDNHPYSKSVNHPDSSNNNNGNHPYLTPGAFLIGNHSDELTPWLPVLATTTRASGYLSIPCCAWTFDERYSRSRSGDSYSSAGGDGSSAGNDAGGHSGSDEQSFIASLNLGGDGTHKSSYSMYRIWLAHLSEWLGWRVECETLRIPSTRNWALVGRTRTGDPDLALARAQAIIAGVIQRGTFKTRKPEGKAGEH